MNESETLSIVQERRAAPTSVFENRRLGERVSERADYIAYHYWSDTVRSTRAHWAEDYSARARGTARATPQRELESDSLASRLAQHARRLVRVLRSVVSVLSRLPATLSVCLLVLVRCFVGNEW